MISIQQLARLICLPIAMSIFLLAAHSAGGLTLRGTDHVQVALR